MTRQTAPVQTYASQYDAIAETMQCYVDGVREGKRQLMRPAFHPAATFFGHDPGGVMTGPIEPLFAWVTTMAPPRIFSLALPALRSSETASVRLEIEHVLGTVAGADVLMSDLFTLMMTENG